MKFEWDGDRTLEWTQQTNPLDPTIQGSDLNVCKDSVCTTTGGATSVNFQGLSISDLPESTHIDGSPTGTWWYAVGVKALHEGGFPAYPQNVAAATKLFVWASATSTGMRKKLCEKIISLYFAQLHLKKSSEGPRS